MERGQTRRVAPSITTPALSAVSHGSRVGGPRKRVRGGLLGAGALAGAAGLILAGSAVMAHVITRPRRLRVVAAREIDDSVEDITFRTDDGLTLHGWYLEHPAPRDAIVIGHGFAMNRNELLDLAFALRARGHAVLLFDFRAHGGSEGGRSTIGYREAGDISAAAVFLGSRPELAGRRIGVAGISMGAAAALMAAARDERIAAVSADSSFATLHDIAAGGLRQIYRLPAFPFVPLIVRFGELLTRVQIGANRPIDAVAAIAPRPLLLIHGAADGLIPVDNAQDLYAAAGEPKELWIVPDLGHAAAFLRMPDEYIERLDRFFNRALDGEAAGGGSPEPVAAGS